MPPLQLHPLRVRPTAPQHWHRPGGWYCTGDPVGLLIGICSGGVADAEPAVDGADVGVAGEDSARVLGRAHSGRADGGCCREEESPHDIRR
eukprot:7298527-Pyramimonas_sp.AAC.1